ncbi:hypothetical protein, partial [uncultured Tateyamaria sp.]|uniref:hypothetical protein n=1 Tax=uncultured Tateyamaria sp. TaxID=455651 RepID=UPI002619FA77
NSAQFQIYAGFAEKAKGDYGCPRGDRNGARLVEQGMCGDSVNAAPAPTFWGQVLGNHIP